MIITITINPSIDQTITVNNFKLDFVNQVNFVRKDAGGKGVNVAKVLNVLQADVLATGFVAGSTGNEFINLLAEYNLKTKFIKANGQTRTNLKIIDPTNNTTTDINQNGAEVTWQNIELLITTLTPLLSKTTHIVLSGSVPASLPSSTYANIINSISQLNANIKFVVDASGSLLANAIKCNLFLIKPNMYELSQALNTNITTPQQALQHCQQLVQNGVQNIALSMGKSGLLFVNNTQALLVKAPLVQAVSTVGAGDSLLGALVYGFSQNMPLADCLQLAVAFGSAKVTTNGTNLPSLQLVNTLKQQVTINKF